jgi:single-strand DNA-binding protein
MFNKVILVGNLTRDIELRYASNSNTAIAKTGIATSRKFKSNNEQREEVMYIDITFFGRSAEISNQYLRKGSKVLIEGRLMLENWVDQNGQKRSRHSITVENMQMLDNKGGSQSGNSSMGGGYQAPQMEDSYQAPQMEGRRSNAPVESSLPEIDINEDQIPF